MIAWIESPGRLRYVAAVFDDRGAAERYLATLPDRIRQASAVESRGDLSLPCYLVEDAAGFRPLSEAETGAYVAGLGEREPGDEGVYAILYRLDGPFLPEVAGRDEMGRLPHIHLEAYHVAAAGQGVAALWNASPV